MQLYEDEWQNKAVSRKMDHTKYHTLLMIHRYLFYVVGKPQALLCRTVSEVKETVQRYTIWIQIHQVLPSGASYLRYIAVLRINPKSVHLGVHLHRPLHYPVHTP